ncbi:cyclophilin-like fold protein [Tractidigestivibacter sp.]|jgi:hypothetical protein|uniref:cyclophilin-like fold protein n=1 Tax=Tractidigestivibacter sp. TaxID=2847320 RepID=UPI003D9088B0
MLTRREFLATAAMAASLPLAACGQDGSQTEEATDTMTETDATTDATTTTTSTTSEEDSMKTFELEVGERAFTGSFADTEAADELASQLPLSLEMNELSGNEKFCYTDQEFPGEEEVPSELHAGEIWIYSGSCIVLFYKNHANAGYSYKFVGSLDDASGLEEAVGTGSVEITLR